eukprot:gb/GECH01013994.1/.p1 GENE.gb/GECH01013994.1/~~gb/GECH01013994.1/.p1  ORF type:complete len:343 (+),score=74.61 gb/GECH01013994.1/:1-1029(+)
MKSTSHSVATIFLISVISVLLFTPALTLDLPGILGDLINIEAGLNVITFNNAKLSIDVDVSIQVEVDAEMDTQPPQDLLNSFVDSGVAYTLKFEGEASSRANATCEFVTKALSNEFVNRIGTDFDTVAAIQWDADVQAYHYLDNVTFDESTQKVTAGFEGKGQIRVIGVQEGNFDMPTLFGKTRKVVQGSEMKLSYPDGFGMDMTAEGDFDLVVDHSSSPQVQFEGYTALGAFFDIRQSKEVVVDAVMRLNYTTQQIEDAAIDVAAHLRFATYNTTQSAWEFVSGGSVDVDAQVVVQSTTHFSEWGVYENPDADESGAMSQHEISILSVVVSFLFMMVMMSF